ncbi:putative protein N(5)-glutamine methyltransferase [Solicola gregarius]|uniref:peptide chain release factor N(5)-glutamine methyltransferase n=1 Tax=Solicola gregarius TaxID=2908642 RepID=A0AA46TDR4_9ACTN|nr:putative protein N(5)-glutamine methyltransferase [Solicola gregarius]UYM03427.1 putative protein N(5)-glutamine methyltransferase [Solicola gregarius]
MTQDVVDALRSAGCVFAEDEARLLVEAATTPDELSDLVDERVAGTPLEHILGWVEFHGLRISVDRGLFVPRRRTEVLVREAVALAVGGTVVVELCCGVAAVATAIASDVAGVEAYAGDVDPAAVRFAARNLGAFGGHAYEGDLFDALPETLRGRIDIIVANAPYVPTDAIATMPVEARSYEPRVSLDGGPDGVQIHRRIAADAAAWLAPGGHLLIETSERQAPLTVDAYARGGLAARVIRAEDVDGTAVAGSTPA